MNTMREMTPGELHAWYERRVLPCGHGGRYLPGPRGGLMQNVKCPVCALALNVVDPTSEFDVASFPFGQVIEAPADYVPPSVPLLVRIRNVFKGMHG